MRLHGFHIFAKHSHVLDLVLLVLLDILVDSRDFGLLALQSKPIDDTNV